MGFDGILGFYRRLAPIILFTVAVGEVGRACIRVVLQPFFFK